MYSAYKAKHFNYADIFANSLALLYNQHVKSQEAIEPKNKEGKTDKQKVAQSSVSLDIVQIVAGNGFLCSECFLSCFVCTKYTHSLSFHFLCTAYHIISCNFFIHILYTSATILN